MFERCLTEREPKPSRSPDAHRAAQRRYRARKRGESVPKLYVRKDEFARHSAPRPFTLQDVWRI